MAHRSTYEVPPSRLAVKHASIEVATVHRWHRVSTTDPEENQLDQPIQVTFGSGFEATNP